MDANRLSYTYPQKVGIKCHHRKQTEGKSGPKADRPGSSVIYPNIDFPNGPPNPYDHPSRNLNVCPADLPSKAPNPTCCTDSYPPLPPAPASAAAFLAEIGIRPLSQNTKHEAALCKLGRSRFLSARPARGTHLHTSSRELPQPSP